MNKLFLVLILFFAIGNAYALTQTGEDTGSFNINARAVQTETCVEDWSCSYWGACSSGAQQFTCRDCNSCNTYNFLPTTCASTRTCSSGNGGGGGGHSNSESGPEQVLVQCSESWVCTDWGQCINSKQTRTCIDNAKCETSNIRPLEESSCEESQEITSNGITGAVVSESFSKTPFIIAGVFIVIIVAIKVTFSLLNRKSN